MTYKLPARYKLIVRTYHDGTTPFSNPVAVEMVEIVAVPNPPPAHRGGSRFRHLITPAQLAVWVEQGRVSPPEPDEAGECVAYSFAPDLEQEGQVYSYLVSPERHQQERAWLEEPRQDRPSHRRRKVLRRYLRLKEGRNPSSEELRLLRAKPPLHLLKYLI